ncbi:hypothetical protein K491DRAFT_721941 [Lophiostoma macrostomum CBS 122681]|uniref:Uncharacterized protein n=1 Tax=Lophiostoma macrostomum CBS 122681 TaxID=1314788 RepID=A0A6A6SML2_9PLEO|nr:hypothetical protein K491DRAFT_721941 [Lophiostoma macrostomum CBS 122681]
MPAGPSLFYLPPEVRVIIYNHIAADASVYDCSGLFLCCKQLHYEASAEVVNHAQKHSESMGDIWPKVFRRPIRALVPETLAQTTTLVLLLPWQTSNVRNWTRIYWSKYAPLVFFRTVHIKFENVPEHSELEDAWRFLTELMLDVLLYIRCKYFIVEWRSIDLDNRAERAVQALKKELVTWSSIGAEIWDLRRVDGKEAIVWSRKHYCSTQEETSDA